jgi:hypothetical protein
MNSANGCVSMSASMDSQSSSSIAVSKAGNLETTTIVMITIEPAEGVAEEQE